MEVMTKLVFTSQVIPQDGGWFITTDLPEIGDIHAFAETYEEIDVLVRTNICGYMDWNPFDFDLKYEFPGAAPKYFEE